MKNIIKLSFICLIIALISGCGSLSPTPVPPTPGVLTYILITPANVRLAKDTGTIKFKAVGYDQYDNTVYPPITPTWSVSAEIGTILSSGTLTVTTEAATGEVYATYGGVTGETTVTVTNGTLQSITVNPAVDNFFIGYRENGQFTASGKDTNGIAVAVSPLWAASVNIGYIDANGYFSAVFPGGTSPVSGVITATKGAKFGQSTVYVYDYNLGF